MELDHSSTFWVLFGGDELSSQVGVGVSVLHDEDLWTSDREGLVVQDVRR